MTTTTVPASLRITVPVTVDTFDDFVHSTGTRLMRTAVLLTGDRSTAEDLLQNAYARLFSKWKQVRRADHPLAYARRVMLRLHLDEKRRRRIVEVHTEAETSAPGSDPTTRLALMQALATLSALDRAVVVLRYWEDLSVADTAEQLGLSPVTCRTRSHRALKHLRTQFPSLATPEDCS
ncbi:SigE family RNA polymerase sigma factor [Nocardioides yefusunii]|uniref:SigE family RNA polymerase sigma factor n=1 Tax=Nocardioides yefusunii TaxID=2500546 RepID=A0ABW1QVI9_9ACTN|nr:SigE family RNA polymerase sigma factor [Nocardioides yefusunii]